MAKRDRDETGGVGFDRVCMGLGYACVLCGIALPEEEEGERDCPARNDDVSREETKRNSPHDYSDTEPTEDQ